MNVHKKVEVTYTLELDSDEFDTLKSVINDLTFDYDNISNRFEVTDKDTECLNLIRNYINNIQYE